MADWVSPPYLFITDRDEKVHGPFLPDALAGSTFSWKFGPKWDGTIKGWVEFIGLSQPLGDTVVVYGQSLEITIEVVR